MAGFGLDRGGGGGGYGRDLAEFITMASGNQSNYGSMQRVSIHCTCTILVKIHCMTLSIVLSQHNMDTVINWISLCH